MAQYATSHFSSAQYYHLLAQINIMDLTARHIMQPSLEI